MSDVSLSPEARSILEAGAAYGHSQEFLQEMAEVNSTRTTHYRTFEDYYTSENQRVRLTDRVRRWLQISGFLWCENFCEVVVDALAERLILEQFDLGDDTDEGTDNEDSPATTWVKDMWRFNRMDELQSIVHTNTVMKGDGYIIVDLDSVTGNPVFHYNRPEIIKPIYDSEHPEVILFAAKVWTSKLETPTNPAARPVMRMNLYYPDRCEKWFNAASDGSADWSQHLDTGDTAWPIPWTDTGELGGEPLGVPVFHFKNKSKGKTWGVSEIRGTIPQQDALNKNILDLHMIMDQQGAPQRWGTGIKAEDRTTMTGNASTVWVTSNPDAKYGQFDPADPAGALKVLEAALQRIAGRSRTPLFLLVLSGDAPSGESLKTAETGLNSKVLDRQVPFGNKWVDTWMMGAKLAKANGTLDQSVDIDADWLKCVWRDPTSRNEYEQREGLQIAVRELGLSKHTALTELGYDADQEAALKDEETTSAMSAFNKGLPTTPVGTMEPPNGAMNPTNGTGRQMMPAPLGE